ncbi:MAG: putative Ig domain-containing protein [Phycisphaerae bacterium]|nr:putative Ig domain-containing protein [Phycisphaerae bacterium]
MTVWMFSGDDCAGASSSHRLPVILRDNVVAVHIGMDANEISLGQAPFFHPFQRHLVSKSGALRKHAAIRAVLIPRDAKGDLDRPAAIEAAIDRSVAADRLVFSDLGTLTLSPDGTLSGQLRNGDRNAWKTGAFLILTAVVFDQLHAVIPDDRLVDEFQLPLARLDSRAGAPEAEKLVSDRFFFYREWSPDWRDLPEPGEGQGVDAHCAVCRVFSLLLLSDSQGYDPNEYPLQAYCPPSNAGALTTRMVVALSVRGGIEPYEGRTSVLPPGLKWDSRNLTISGVPEKAGTYSVAIEIKDRQFPAGDWERARNAKQTLGTPYQQLITTFDIRRPIEAELQLPPYSRTGGEVSAVCLCKGGPGRAVFEGLKLPPGIQIDRESGRIYGIPTQVGEHQVQVRVASLAGGNEALQSTTAEGTWRIIEPLPTPAIR